MVSWYWLQIGNYTLRIQWSHDRWRHVTRKAKVVTPIPLKLNISKTVRNGWIATKLAHDGPQYSPRPRSAQCQGQGKRSRDTDTSVMSRNVAIQYRLTFWLYMQLYEVPLHSPSTIDVMSTSWNELLRRFRCVRSPLTWYINFSFVHLQYISSYVRS